MKSIDETISMFLFLWKNLWTVLKPTFRTSLVNPSSRQWDLYFEKRECEIEELINSYWILFFLVGLQMIN